MTAYDAENHLIGAGWNNRRTRRRLRLRRAGQALFSWTAGTFDHLGRQRHQLLGVMYSPSGQKLVTYLIPVATNAPTTAPASPSAARFQPATSTSAAAAWR